MQAAPRISLAVPLPEAEDFATLLAAATAHAQAVSGGVWTDYNEHDPGVTILEALCYALTDIAYRAGHPMADLLASSAAAHKVSPEHQALFPPEQVFTTAPVTPSDLEEWLTASIPAIRGAQLYPVRDKPGHFRLQLDAQAKIVGNEINESELAGKVRAQIAAHRPMGIAIDSTDFNTRQTYVIEGEIGISGNASAEDVMAELLFAAMELDDPAPPRPDIPPLPRGRFSPARIFNGPVPQLAPPGAVPGGGPFDDSPDDTLDDALDDAGAHGLSPLSLRAAAQSIAGVQEVRHLHLDSPAQAAPIELPVHRRAIRAGRVGTGRPGDGAAPRAPIRLIPSLEAKDLQRLRLIRNGARVTVDPEAVNARLLRLEADRRWAALYDRGALERQQDSVVARGNPDRQLARYRSIQFLFPQVYGLGLYGLDTPGLSPDPASINARKTEVLQLKGYLALFEQVLADELAQLDAIALLFSSQKHGQSYFKQPLAHDPPREGEPPHADLVLGAARRDDWLATYQRGLDRIGARNDPFRDRNTRAASHLLARFGIRFDDAALLRQFEADHLDADQAMDCVIAQKRAYLTGVPDLGHKRGLGPDLSKNDTACALETAVRLRTGMPDHMLIVEHAQLHLPDRISDMQCIAAQVPGGHLHLVMEEHLPTSALDVVTRLLRGAICDRPEGQGLPAGVSVHSLPDYTAAMTLDIAGLPRMAVAERFASVSDGRAALARMAADFPPLEPARFPVDFTGNFLSVVLPHDKGVRRSDRPEFSAFVERTLLESLPAHLGVQCLWVPCDSYDRMARTYLQAAAAPDHARRELMHLIENAACRSLIREYLDGRGNGAAA